ncbi:hypothetical protein BKA62DRAFT_827276 [Auriculariales sp. MPI-PUGE-AT-0066]|nr:hypothetical protein BKA62DRAFT_827276 [Auriculariales sp. MPI-PUGE-AT-0066]
MSKQRKLQFELESDRVESFRRGSGWPHGQGFAATPNSLAQAGFRFMWDDGDDMVKCFACGKGLSDWEAADDPFAIHFQKNPKCEWALARCSVELDKDARGRWSFKDKARLPSARALVKARQDTFRIQPKIWPPDQIKGHAANSKKMAEAGFVYTPQEPGDDCASCVYCDTSLSGWEPEDSPLEEHRRREKNCPIFSAVLFEEEENVDPIPAKSSKSKGKRPTKSVMPVAVTDSAAEDDQSAPTTKVKKGKSRATAVVEDEPPQSLPKAGKSKARRPQSDAEVEEVVPQRETRTMSQLSVSQNPWEPDPSLPPPSALNRRGTTFAPKSRQTLTANPDIPQATVEPKAEPVAKTTRSRRTAVESATETEPEHGLVPIAKPSRSRKTKAVIEVATETEPEPEIVKKSARKGKAVAEFATEPELDAPLPKKSTGRKTRKTAMTDAEESQSQAEPSRNARSRTTRNARATSHTVTESEVDVRSTRRGTRVQAVTATETEDEPVPVTTKSKNRSKTKDASKKATSSRKTRVAPTESEYSEAAAIELRYTDNARDTIVLLSSDDDPPPLKQRAESSRTATSPRPASAPGHTKKKIQRNLKSAPPQPADEEEPQPEGRPVPLPKSTALAKTPRKPQIEERRISIKFDDGLKEGEVIGLLPTKKKRVPKAKPELEPEPERVEPSRFRSFSAMDVDDGGHGNADDGADDEGAAAIATDDETTEDEDDVIELPDLPDLPALDALGAQLELGYEDPFLSPSKRNSGMHLVTMDAGDGIRTSTPTKNKNKGKGKGKEKQLASPSPPSPMMLADKTPVPTRIKAVPAHLTEDVDMLLGSPAPAELISFSPVKPITKKPASLMDVNVDAGGAAQALPAAAAGLNGLVFNEPPVKPAVPNSKLQTIPPSLDSSESSIGSSGAPATPSRVHAPEPTTPFSDTPGRQMTIFKAKNKLEIPPLSELTEEEQAMTVEQWVRYDMARVRVMVVAAAQAKINGFRAQAQSIQQQLDTLSLDSDDED